MIRPIVNFLGYFIFTVASLVFCIFFLCTVFMTILAPKNCVITRRLTPRTELTLAWQADLAIELNTAPPGATSILIRDDRSYSRMVQVTPLEYAAVKHSGRISKEFAGITVCYGHVQAQGPYMGQIMFVYDYGIERAALIPRWLLLLSSAISPITWITIRLRRKIAPGICATCGYDLRASSNRCPECGTAF